MAENPVPDEVTLTFRWHLAWWFRPLIVALRALSVWGAPFAAHRLGLKAVRHAVQVEAVNG